MTGSGGESVAGLCRDVATKSESKTPRDRSVKVLKSYYSYLTLVRCWILFAIGYEKNRDKLPFVAVFWGSG